MAIAKENDLVSSICIVKNIVSGVCTVYFVFAKCILHLDAQNNLEPYYFFVSFHTPTAQ